MNNIFIAAFIIIVGISSAAYAGSAMLNLHVGSSGGNGGPPANSLLAQSTPTAQAILASANQPIKVR